MRFQTGIGEGGKGCEMFSKPYDNTATGMSKRYFKLYQTKDGSCQIATPKYDTWKWNFELIQCNPILDWPADATVVLTADRRSDIADLPWFVGDGTFASKRFCDLAIDIGKDQVQLLPVKTELDGLDESQTHSSYSVVNWLRKVDCLHRELAGFGTHPKYGFETAQSYVLDESLIPDDAIVFRVKHKPTALVVREDFLEKLSSHSITGWDTMEKEIG